ncbi:CDP-glycerol glycerophosphotransferase family protein [Clostridiisalibacter paucivorans]|uniref:CDP-glycerol glycerophosphotransferase family protein n=1 Tax=Clostridiisalibacter paucivorans TaxID=408753 RepID=UPI0012EBC30C|nr:CDP-glycerol glycerophosphotransferase family protein [Clostridiisalibacter paucivorans]
MKLPKAIFRPVVNIFRKFYMFTCNQVFGIDPNKVVFISFRGKLYSDSCREISEKLYESNFEYDIIWLFNEPETKSKVVPPYVKIVKNNTLKALRELATAKIWVDNFQKSRYTYKSNEQLYIQTWHGDKPMKKVLYDSIKHKNDNFIEEKICDLFIAGSDFGSKLYKTAFNYKGEILKTGLPRNDKLVNIKINNINEQKKVLEIPENYKVVLFAPTLRDTAIKNKTKQKVEGIDLVEVINELETLTNKNWLCLIRAHSSVSGLNGIQKDNRIINVSDYEDMSDLLIVSDVLITDYSSTAGDFAILNRPIILFQPDIDDYLSNERAFYYEMVDTPFFRAMNQEELLKLLHSLNDEKVIENCRLIKKFYGISESGHSAENVVDFIIEHTR